MDAIVGTRIIVVIPVIQGAKVDVTVTRNVKK
jgi:hypothetical protein